MTGESIPTKANWPKLKPYYRKLVAATLFIVGAFLSLEHLFQFGGFDLLDIIGHETYGFALILLAILVGTKWEQWETLKLWNWRNWFR